MRYILKRTWFFGAFAIYSKATITYVLVRSVGIRNV